MLGSIPLVHSCFMFLSTRKYFIDNHPSVLAIFKTIFRTVFCYLQRTIQWSQMMDYLSTKELCGRTDGRRRALYLGISVGPDLLRTI